VGGFTADNQGHKPVRHGSVMIYAQASLMFRLPEQYMRTLFRRYMSAPRLLRLFFEQALMGAAVGLFVAGTLFHYDIAGLGSLISGSEIWLAASFLYFFTFALTFAAAMIATAMLLNID
jgi:hypothetical protein